MRVSKYSKTNRSWYFFWIGLIFLFMLIIVYLVFYRVMEFFQQMDPMLARIKETLHPLHPKIESLQFYEGRKSYTINKKKIYLCLRDEHRQYYDFNMLIYVAIHEISHVLCDEIGHTPKFYDIFKELLGKAEKMQIYDSKKPIIRNYCGHT